MSRFLKSLTCVAALGALAASNGQATWAKYDHSATEAANYRIKAYELSVEEEKEFNDSVVVKQPQGDAPRWWYAWDAPNLANPPQSVTIDGLNNYDWGTPATAVSDGQVRLKVAYGDSGIYFLFEVQDQAWAGYVNAIDYANDAIELFANKNPTTLLYGDQIATYLPCLNGGTTSNTGFAQQMNPDYFQLQIRFGGLEPVTTFSYNYWNPLETDVNTFGCFTETGLITYNRATTFAQALSAYGMAIDILPQVGNWRSETWMIPWRTWGAATTTAITRKTKGQMVAMTFGYNNLNPQTQTHPTAFRWRGCTPYSNTATQFTAGTIPVWTSYDAWGDILFDEKLDVVSPPAGWPSAVKSQVSPIKAAKSLSRSEYFTVDGRSITSVRALPANTVVLHRATLDNGKTITARVPLSAVR